MEDQLFGRALLGWYGLYAEEQTGAGSGRLFIVEDVGAVGSATSRIHREPHLGPSPEQLGQASISVRHRRVSPD
jgi:hypothetical protein